MKGKKIFSALTAFAAVCTVFAINAFAEGEEVIVKVDNEAVEFDQQPIIIGEGYTMVPVRAVFEKAGAEVSWDNDTETAKIVNGAYTVTIKYGDTAIYKNGERIELESPPIMENNRILIPVRAIAEAMDYSVTWDGHHNMVLLSTTGKPYRAFAFLKTGFRVLEDSAELFSNSEIEQSIDLDGDGVAETVEFNGTNDTTAVSSPILKINGMDYTASLGSLTSVYSIAVTDINTKDSVKEIVVSENGDTLTAHFYRYDNGILKVINNNNGVPVEVPYASRLLISGTGYIISDLNGVCFVDIMVTGGIYQYRSMDNADENTLSLSAFSTLEPIYDRNLYKTYDDKMLYHIIYTSDYKPGTYKDVTDTGVISSDQIERFKIIDGYLDENDRNYIELYIELPDGTRAVIKPYQT